MLSLSLNSLTLLSKVFSCSAVTFAPLLPLASPLALPSPVGLGFGVSLFGALRLSFIPPLGPTSANKSVYLVKDTLITPGSSAVLVGGEQKVVLEATDFLAVTSSVANSADVTVSALELS